jgi:hypothetical protein
VSGLAPGEYTLQVTPAGRRGADISESASSLVTVNGSDLTCVHLVGTKPATITGHILAGSSATQSLRSSSIAIQIVAATPGTILGPPARGTVKDDFSFEAQARPGRVRVNVAPLPSGWTVKSVRYRGVDVTDTGLDVRPDEVIDGLDIELTDQITTVTGLVSSMANAPLKEYALVVFAREADQWSFPRYQRVARPDQDGRFKITGLPSGGYYGIALDYVDPGEASDPELLDRLKVNATAFSLRDGETKQLDLRLSAIP